MNQPFAHLESIYRNYDIRGRYPEEITEDEVEKIGAAIVAYWSPTKVAVGRDIRPSSEPLCAALVRGITRSGAHVLDLGVVTTPMTYYICGSTDVDVTVMITASHMPSAYNGLKISVGDAQPVTKDILEELKRIVGEHTYSAVQMVGTVTDAPPHAEWRNKFRAQHAFTKKPYRIVVDPANMVGALEIETLKALEPELEVIAIYDDFDPTCPNHEANPLNTETLVDLGVAVREHQADLGIAFDGDADRVGFVDEYGAVVSSDIIGALLARVLLKKYPGEYVLFDQRSSKAVGEEIERSGGIPLEWKVGHTNIRTKMRELNAVLGIELAGHYFFRDTYFSEGGPYPVFLILELMEETGKTLSELVAEVKRYHHSGEINRHIETPLATLYDRLQRQYPEAEVRTLDGLKLVCTDWWCNVRPSANDPVVRLNVEADTRDLMELRRDELLRLIEEN
jgi:phosphomannomutase